jgi:FixJ family two-component response regulator
MSFEGLGAEPEGQRETELPLIGIVDAQQSVREEISSLIKSAGYKTTIFESVEAYLEDGRKHEVRCLVLDIDMLGLGALDLQRQLTRMEVAIPIIFATAQSDVLRAVALTDGAGSVLQKPFTEVALLRAIRSALKFPGRSSRSK